MKAERSIFREPIANWPRVEYKNLTARQKENYNFQQVASLLSIYGFNCIRLSDDWNGADFLAIHHASDETLKVQLKAGLEIHKKYFGKRLYIAFPLKGSWYLIEHDQLLDLCGAYTSYLNTEEWNSRGWYYTATANPKLREALEYYALTPSQE